MDTYNLLVIDDDPNIRKLLGELLAGRTEFNLLLAGDGPEAVRQFAAQRIDLVLTDIHMPGFTGLELMADMKKINLKPEILVMTANATPENVETARKIGARSVILKPFDDLEVLEAEINKALRAAKAARARRNGGNGGGLKAPAEGPPAASGPVIEATAAAPQPAPTSQRSAPPVAPAAQTASPPAPKAAAWTGPKPDLWPTRKAAAPAPAPQPVKPPASPAPVEAVEAVDVVDWQDDLTGNETPAPPAARPPTAVKPPAAAKPAVASPAPPRAAAPPAPPAPKPATPPPPPVEAAPPATPQQPATEKQPDESLPGIPADLEAIFRMATSFDTGKMGMQVPIVCLQTWEEKGAIGALRRLAGELKREFFVWSAARGLVKEDGTVMGEAYRDAGRTLEFVRRQKHNGLYVLADFRPCLDDRTVVRVLREMVMELETARLMLVLTAPRLPSPPELAQSCVTFDWPSGGDTDLNGLYHEVVAEVAASTGRVPQLDASSRAALLERVKDMPAGRARFEIARHLMTAASKG